MLTGEVSDGKTSVHWEDSAEALFECCLHPFIGPNKSHHLWPPSPFNPTLYPVRYHNPVPCTQPATTQSLNSCSKTPSCCPPDSAAQPSSPKAQEYLPTAAQQDPPEKGGTSKTSTSAAPPASEYGSALQQNNQSADAQAANAASDAVKQKPNADKPDDSGKPAASGWGADLLTQNQAAAAKAAEAAAEAVKAKEAASTPTNLQSKPADSTQDTEASTSAAAAPAPMAFKFGVPPSAQTVSGSTQQGPEASKPAALTPIMSGPFRFGVPLPSAAAHTSSPPMAIPPAKHTGVAQDGGESSLVGHLP